MADGGVGVARLDEYRIGVVGPPNAGSGLLLSGLQRAANMECAVCARQEHRTLDHSLHDSSEHSCDVFSVIVKEKGPLGIKIAKHKKYCGFVSVKEFVRNQSGDMYEIEKSGKVHPGDLLVAVNRQTLLNMPQQNVTDILRNDSGVRVLTFLRTVGGGSAVLTGIDHSTSSTLGVPEVVPTEVGNCKCCTWRTFVDIADRRCCFEIVDIPANDSDLSLLRSHLCGLDGIIFVYSLEMMSSLLMLEKKYARPFAGLLSACGISGGIETFPLVVAGTLSSRSIEPVSPSGLAANQLAQKNMLLAEGNTFAEVWGAPSVVEAPINLDGIIDGDFPYHLTRIFESLVSRIDNKDDLSAFEDEGYGCMGFLPALCFGDSATPDQSCASKACCLEEDGHMSSRGDGAEFSHAPSQSRRRIYPRKMRNWPNAASPRSIIGQTGHPSEESSVWSQTSTKMMKYILSSCE